MKWWLGGLVAERLVEPHGRRVAREDVQGEAASPRRPSLTRSAASISARPWPRPRCSSATSTSYTYAPLPPGASARSATQTCPPPCPRATRTRSDSPGGRGPSRQQRRVVASRPWRGPRSSGRPRGDPAPGVPLDRAWSRQAGELGLRQGPARDCPRAARADRPAAASACCGRARCSRARRPAAARRSASRGDARSRSACSPSRAAPPRRRARRPCPGRAAGRASSMRSERIDARRRAGRRVRGRARTAPTGRPLTHTS